MTRLHLLVGGLDRVPPDHLPHLRRLLTRGRVQERTRPPGMSAALADLFGLAARDLAAVAYAGDGGDPGDSAWFRADPVHLLAGMHSVTLFDSRQFPLRADEAAALVDALNRHFGAEIEFLAPTPTRWYARFQAAPDIEVPPLDQVAGAMIGLDQIAGPDARALQRATMEIQMLLHDHPVNAAREARGEAIVNGIWLWGGGTWRQPAAPFDQVLADDFLARALATAAGIPHAPLSAGLGQSAGRRHTLAVLDAAEARDPDWFKPALRALQGGRLDEIELTLTDRQAGRHRIGRWQSLCFWR